jgi:hypothetical protein
MLWVGEALTGCKVTTYGGRWGCTMVAACRKRIYICAFLQHDLVWKAGCQAESVKDAVQLSVSSRQLEFISSFAPASGAELPAILLALFSLPCVVRT